MARRNSHLLLDDLKLWLSQATLNHVDLKTIRTQSLSNLRRWKAQGTWGKIYDEWWQIMMYATDDDIKRIMTRDDEESNRLRQSFPYVGLLDDETRRALLAKYQTSVASNDSVEDVDGAHGNDAY